MPDESSAFHSLIQNLDRLTLIEDLTPGERLVCVCLLVRGDWRTGEAGYCDLDTLIRWTRLNRRTVQRALDRITCKSPQRRQDGAAVPCYRCGGPDVLLMLRAHRYNAPAVYALVLGDVAASQPLLPERSWSIQVQEVSDGERSDRGADRAYGARG